MAGRNPENGKTGHGADCMLEKDGRCLVDQKPCEYPPLHKRRDCFNERAGNAPEAEDRHAADINASREKLGLGPLKQSFFKYRQALGRQDENIR